MITLSTPRLGTTGTKLFIHGLLGSGDDWSETIKGIEGDYTCLTIDLPSHGSAADLPATITSFEGAIHQIGASLKETITTPVHGIGYSLGGRILLGLSRHYPELFGRLTLISAFPGFDDKGARNARWESDLRWSALMKTLDTETFLSRWYGQETFRSEMWSDETRTKILSSRASISLSHIAPFFELTSAAQMPCYWPLLDSLSIPTTFIAGERDLKYVQIGEQLASRNPRIHLSIVPQCGHAVLLEDPAAVAKTA
jgi:2-succinyl-6-hydroxy-2,4-cyclohexadiene-1-carboxylate synthase